MIRWHYKFADIPDSERKRLLKAAELAQRYIRKHKITTPEALVDAMYIAFAANDVCIVTKGKIWIDAENTMHIEGWVWEMGNKLS